MSTPTLLPPGDEKAAPGGPFAELRARLEDAAAAFAPDAAALGEILTGLVDDVAVALGEPLEIFPVCHHSPASGLAMIRRLREKQPKVIYLELCEDLAPVLGELRNCQLPVAVQAFAHELSGFPPGTGPLSVIAPITEASAEYQAISYALGTPGVDLVLVDWSADHLFQWDRDHRTSQPAAPGGAEPEDPEPEEEDRAALHGGAVGVELGDLRPRFAELEEFLLRHGRVRHWSEWWAQYVERPLAGADHDTYRAAMSLIGSLFRRLSPGDDDGRLSRDEQRERHMWTRIRAHQGAHGVAMGDCLFVCGAFHAVSRLPEVGSAATAAAHEIPAPTGSTWLHGIVPSSHAAIEAQFGLAGGSVSIARAAWQKELGRARLAPFRLEAAGKKTKPAARRRAASAPVVAAPGEPATPLSGFLQAPPPVDGLDEEELLDWCVGIVRLARRNGYLASTADAIAVFETSVLLAGLRGRARPTPYDFQDAAVTCIEKDAVPGRRDVRRLCEILLGGDRVGRVGYDALPPLARDVQDRLAPLGLDLTKRTVQRALLDLVARPELTACSRLLWILRALLPADAARPILGVRRLGETSVQESWDLALGRYQRALIELGYEALTVEQALEQRLRRAAWSPEATAAVALAAVEDAILYLGGRGLVDELGARAVELLTAERSVDDAPEVLRRIRRLIDYFRVNDPALPTWCEQFVRGGYAHYCTLLPVAFAADETGVRQVASMLGFLLTFENLALALGCDRAQLELAVRQSRPQQPEKVALLWAAQHRLGELTVADLRARTDGLLDNPMLVPTLPSYLAGFAQALDPVPSLAAFVVEAISKAFARLPDRILLPWLPTLITTLRAQAGDRVPALVREAGQTFPARLADLDTWAAPWEAPRVLRAGAAVRPASGAAGPAAALLAEHPAATDAVAALLGAEGTWSAPGAELAPPTSGASEAAALVAAHPSAAHAVSVLLGGG